MKTRVILTAIAALFTLSPGAHARLTDEAGTLQGAIGVRWNCDDSDGGAVLSLHCANGQSYALDVPSELIESYGGYSGLAGRWFSLKGSLDGRLKRFKVGTIGLARPTDIPLAFREPSWKVAESKAPVSGSKPFLTILARFKDKATITPHPVGWYDALLNTNKLCISAFYAEQSYGQVNLNGSAVLDWINLPKATTAYTSTGSSGVDDEAIIQDAIAAVASKVDFTKYFGINVVVNFKVGKVNGTGGIKSYKLNGVTRLWARAFVNPGDSMFPAIAHEMGHGFGFDHSSGPYSATFDSDWDVMSRGFNAKYVDKVYGPIPVQTNIYHRMLAGWVPSKRIFYALPGTSQTIRLERSTGPTSQGYLAAKVYLGGNADRYLTLETRMGASNYDNAGNLPGSGVIIHDVDDVRKTVDPYTGLSITGRQSQVVDATKNDNPNDDGAIWVPGETYTDKPNGISVKVGTGDATSYNVTITVDATAPSPAVVTNSNDTGGGSLRSALKFASQLPGTTVKFAIPKGSSQLKNGVATLTPLSPLPTISGAGTVIDAKTQPNSSAPFPFSIDGLKKGLTSNGLRVQADNCVIRGIVINRAVAAGIYGEGVKNVLIDQCAVGVDPTATNPLPNDTGIDFRGASSGTIQNCVISGNNTAGIDLQGSGNADWVIVGNKIGTDQTGDVGLGNGGIAVNIVGGVKRVRVGGLKAAERNIIGASTSSGIWIGDAGTSDIQVLGNFVGLGASGSTDLGNGGDGITIAAGASKVTVGGASLNARNYISANITSGVAFLTGANNCTVEGNCIGLSASGSEAFGNQLDGISVSSSKLITIRGNTCSGNNGQGISVRDASTNGVNVVGNIVGLDPTGSIGIGNAYAGIFVDGGATGTLITKNYIGGNSGPGIRINASSKSVVTGNQTGQNLAGTKPIPDNVGIALTGGAKNNRIGGTATGDRNVVGASLASGIGLYDLGTDLNQVQGNLVGFDPTGKIAMTLKSNGINLENGPKNNTIGGATPAARNVVGNSALNGVLVYGAGTDSNTFSGNYIGTDITGTKAAPNTYAGILVAAGAAKNIIGGSSTAGGNLVAGNKANGIALTGKGSEANQVLFNTIGIGSDSTTVLGNGYSGILLSDGASKTQVQNNWVVGFTGPGIVLYDPTTTANLVTSNLIGTDAGLTKKLNSGWGAIALYKGANGNFIGEVGKGNIASFTGYGIYVIDADTVRNRLWNNRLLNMTDVPIDLGGNGLTQNDALDADTGPNNLQNFPTITAIESTATSSKCTLTLSSKPNSRYRIEIYACSAANPKGSGVPDRYLGFVEVTTDSKGVATVSTIVSAAGKGFVCATATDLATLDTSEVSPVTVSK